ncbi:hypothetical protein ILUMI_20945 [Ignelater luminosus]|uniref:Uncharacterized protein n=1 Tax=Ignelater luminosus TaxID=2038154 RepID=A0A8K0G433_IGNLU|nr:hypothetical protein ILUMI_20945 [Ignelater luminosus]
MLFKFVFLLIALVVAFAQSGPVYEDSESAATGDHHHGRVQIKVYRGPDDHGHGHHDFAPWGFWVKQPADDDAHH